MNLFTKALALASIVDLAAASESSSSSTTTTTMPSTSTTTVTTVTTTTTTVTTNTNPTTTTTMADTTTTTADAGGSGTTTTTAAAVVNTNAPAIAADSPKGMDLVTGIVFTVNTTGANCETMAVQASIGSLAACTAVSKAVSDAVTSVSSVPTCDAAKRTVATVDVPVCLTYMDNGVNGVTLSGNVALTTIAGVDAVPMPTDASAKCLFSCTRRALEEQLEVSARGRQLATQTILTTSAHTILSASVIDSNVLNATIDTARNNVANTVAQVRTFMEDGTVGALINMPTIAGNQLTQTTVATGAGSSLTAMQAVTAGTASILGTPTAVTSVTAPGGVVTPIVTSTGATSGAAATHVMGSLALMAAGVLFF